MKKKNQKVMKLNFKFHTKKLVYTTLGVMIFAILSSFIPSQQQDWKTTGQLIYKLAGDTYKKEGCKNAKSALVLLEAYQVIYEEVGGIENKRHKADELIQVLKNSSCTTSAGDIVFNPRVLNPAKITTISGGVTIERKLEPYILALEMMTPKQQEEFKKALPQTLLLEYENWKVANVAVKNEIKATMIRNEVTPIDLDKNLSNVFFKALNENNTIDLKDYNIEKKELDKLLNNQKLIKELNKQVIIQQQ